jgi:hypothetical protein
VAIGVFIQRSEEILLDHAVIYANGPFEQPRRVVREVRPEERAERNRRHAQRLIEELREAILQTKKALAAGDINGLYDSDERDEASRLPADSVRVHGMSFIE